MLIGGALKINIKGYVLASGAVTFEKELNPTNNDGAIPELTGATIQAIKISDLNMFVGVNGAFIEDADGNVTGLDTDSATGFSVAGGSLDIVTAHETTSRRPRWGG